MAVLEVRRSECRPVNRRCRQRPGRGQRVGGFHGLGREDLGAFVAPLARRGKAVRAVKVAQDYAKGRDDTIVIVTADHGELFGEMGYFGHGPIMHEKCFEVPFVEGRLA